MALIPWQRFKASTEQLVGHFDKNTETSLINSRDFYVSWENMTSVVPNWRLWFYSLLFLKIQRYLSQIRFSLLTI